MKLYGSLPCRSASLTVRPGPGRTKAPLVDSMNDVYPCLQTFFDTFTNGPAATIDLDCSSLNFVMYSAHVILTFWQHAL